MPFEYVPSGRRYSAPDFQNTRVQGSVLFEKASAALADTLHQRHLAQVGFVDRLVGDLIARLRSTGAYDEALVIITSDHGASYREGRRRREPRPAQQNLSDILQVPLFMKLPGQQQGEVVDRIVETVDIFPTILDVVGAKASLRLDGRSLIDGRDPGRPQFLPAQPLQHGTAPARRFVGGSRGEPRAKGAPIRPRRSTGTVRASQRPAPARNRIEPGRAEAGGGCAGHH